MIIKSILLGDMYVGKTSLINTYYTGEYYTNRHYTSPTLGAELYNIHRNMNQANSMIIHCWDTAGNNKYGHLIKRYFYDVDCAIFVYDVTDKNTYNNCKVGSGESAVEYVLPEFFVQEAVRHT